MSNHSSFCITSRVLFGGVTYCFLALEVPQGFEGFTRWLTGLCGFRVSRNSNPKAGTERAL